MTDHQLHQFNEAKRLIAEKMSKRKAAEQVGVNHSTLLRWLSKDETPQAATVMVTDPEAEPHVEAHPSLAAIDWDSIYRATHPPLTQAEKSQREQDERLIELRRKQRNDN